MAAHAFAPRPPRPVQVASREFPQWDRNLNTGGPLPAVVATQASSSALAGPPASRRPRALSPAPHPAGDATLEYSPHDSDQAGSGLPRPAAAAPLRRLGLA